MYIFYDFETSQKDFLGQILSYYFVLVDETFQPIQEAQPIGAARLWGHSGQSAVNQRLHSTRAT